MKIMNKVTLEYLKKNRKRTVVTIIGVIISVAMITAISTFYGSFTDLMQRNEIELDGGWHEQFLDVAKENIPQITDDPNVKSAVLGKELGVALLRPAEDEDSQNTYLFVTQYDTESFSFRRMKLTDGRYPSAPGELLITDRLNEYNNLSLKPGDTVTVPVGDRTDGEGNPLPWNAFAQEEHFEERFQQTFTIVGVLDTQDNYRNPSNAYTWFDPSVLAAGETLDVTVELAKVPHNIHELEDHLDISSGIQYHEDLLRYMGILGDRQVEGVFLTVAIIVGSIVMIGSVLLIYNAFAISISERSRQLGMLSSIGATRKQKRNSVLFEGAVIGVIAIPFGLIFGTLGIGITFWLVSPLIQNTLNVVVPMRVVFSPLSILVAIFFSALTILISVWIPAKRASQITPIEAIRQSKDVNLNGKAVKTSRLTRRIFGFEGELALKNLKRNKKRYRTTVFSLSVSIVLFLTAATFTHYINSSFEMTQDQLQFNVMGYLSSSTSTELTKEEAAKIIDDLRGVDKIDRFAVTRYYSGSVTLPASQVTPELQNHLIPNEDGSYFFNTEIHSLNDEELRRYAEEVGVDYTALTDPENPQGILLNSVNLRRNNNFEALNMLRVEAGDTLPIETTYAEDGTPQTQYPLRVAAATGVTAFITGNVTMSPDFLTYYVSEAVFDQLAGYFPNQENPSYSFCVDAQDSKAVSDAMNTILQNAEFRGSASDLTESLKGSQQLATLVAVFVYGFVALISLIAVANIFNTISTSIGLRRREFAMIKSVGMTPEGFNRMMNYESIFYGLKSLLFGLPVSAVVMVLLYSALAENFEFRFSVPWGAVIGVVLGVFLIVSLTMLYSSSKVKKANIIDALTEENL